MAQLVFKVATDWQEVVRLREEIARLKAELKSVDAVNTPHRFETLNAQLSQSTKRMDELTGAAAKAGAEMEGGFRKRIYDASGVVNTLTERIINQRAVIKDVEADVKRLGEAYRTASKGGSAAAPAMLREYNSARKALDEEKAALFDLTQQQAKARLHVKQLKDEFAAFKDEVQEDVGAIDLISSKMKGWLGALGVGFGMKEFIGEMVRVRGEFQAADTAIQTLLGSKEKADQLMAKVRDYAKISPLEFSDVTAATQMMLGFNIEAEKVPGFIAAIGDVSMGESQKFNSLTLAFSQMSAAGKLMGQDLNQMINAGFNPLQVMADKTGKSISRLKDEMSKGAISAEMVQQAFIDATSEGGKFYRMSENASKTINGQLSMMQDAWDAALNEMGTASEGVIMKGIQLSTSLISHYETIGKVIAGLVVTYGTYRAALITNIALTHSWAVAARADAAAKAIQTIATKAQTVAQLALNAAMKANPYVMAATLIVGVATAMWALRDSTSEAEKAQSRLNKAMDDFNGKEEQRKQRIEELLRIIQDETETKFEQAKAYEELSRLSPSLVSAYKQEELATVKLAEAQRVLNSERDQAAYNNLSGNVQRYLSYVKALQSAGGNWNNMDDSMKEQITGEYGHRTVVSALDKAQADLQVWQDELRKYNELKRQAEEEAKPVEVRIMEAKADLEQIEEEFEAARKKLEEEQEKARQSPFYSVPFYIQAEYDSSRKRKEQKQRELDALEEERQKPTFADDFEKSRKEWEQAKKKLSAIEADRKSYTTTQYEEARKAKDAAEKRYKELGGVTDKQIEKQQSQANKAHEELMQLMVKNQQDELRLLDEGREKKIRQIEVEYEERINTIRKQAKRLVEANKQSKATGLNENGLTSEQQNEIDKAKALNEELRRKSYADMARQDQASMMEYLKKWGSVEQQRMAITELYNDKISKAVTNGEKLSLKKEMESGLASLEYKNVAMGIDWRSMFSGIDSMSSKMMQLMKDRLDAFTQTDEYRKADSQTQKDVVSLLGEMRSYLGSDNSATWEKLAGATEAFVAAVNAYNKAVEEEKLAGESLAMGKKQLADGEITQEQYDALKRDVDALGEATVRSKEKMDRFATELNNLSDEVANQVSKLTAALNKAKGWQGVEGFTDLKKGSAAIDEWKGAMDTALSTMGDGIGKDITSTLSSTIGKGLSAMGGGLESILSSGLGTVIGFIAQIPQLILGIVDAIKNVVTGILNAVTEIISLRWIDDLVNSILEAVGELIDAIFDLPENLVKMIGSILVDGVGGLLNTVLGRVGNVLTLGLLSSGGPSEWFTNSNAKWVAETTERLTKENERLRSSVDGLKDEMENQGGQKAASTYEAAVRNQQRIEDNQKEILKAQMSYHDAHHSNAYYWGLSRSDYRQMNNLLREYASKNPYDKRSTQTTVASLEDIYKLTPEQMDYIRNHAVDLWNKMLDQGKYDKSEYWDAYADMAGQMEEIVRSFQQSLTQVSFDSLRDSFIDSLMDMDKSAKDFSSDFTKYLMKAVLNARISDMIEDDMKQFYDRWATMSEDGLTSAEIRQLKNDWDELVQRGIEIRDEVAAVTGYTGGSSYQQQASSKGFQAMRQDVGDELNGRFTALQESSIRQEQSMSILSMKVDQLVSIGASMASVVTDTRDIIANSYLELTRIADNTGAIVKPILMMQKDMEEVKRGIKNL